MILKEITAAGKDVQEALANGKAALGVSELDEIKFEIIDGGTKGILGLFSRPAKVRVYIEGDEPQEKKPHHERHRSNRRPERTEGKGKGTGNNRKPKSDDRRRNAPKTENKPKERVIPEVDLKLERKEVNPGEDMSFDFVKTVVSDIGLNAEVELYSCDDGTRRIAIVGEDASMLIGHHGDTLDALQYLANLASARKNVNGERDKSRVTIDIEGYRQKREDTLRALARRMAAKALRNRRSVMLEPMSAYERRIIHSEIQGIDGVSTNSIGSDNNRKIVIYLTDKKPEELFPNDEAELEENTAGAVEATMESDISAEEGSDEAVCVDSAEESAVIDEPGEN
ncbi:MAG: Jag N-terminal domain-containing protein [Clostridia bacterium]|nr:Jag N-terminal domain-containing protein [Clostridia bacterium]